MYEKINTVMKKREKSSSLYVFAMFSLLFPILEGYSNSSIPIGTVGIGAVVIFTWLFETLMLRSMKFGSGGIVLFLFVCWMATSILWSSDQIYSATELTKYIMVFLFYVIANDVINAKEDFLLVVRCYLFGVFCIALSALQNILTGETYNETYNRYSADGFDPNNFGIILSSALPLVLIVFNGKYWWQKIISVFLSLLFVVLIVSSASRAATVSACLYLLGIASVYYGFRKIFQLLVVAVLLIGLVSVGILDVIPQESLDRLAGGVEEDGGGGRSEIWKDAVSVGMNSFWLGNGVAMSYPLMGNQSHNTFVSAFFEGGVIAALLWLLFWIKHFQFVLQVRRMDNKDVFSILLFFSLIGLLVGSLTLNWEFRKTLYLIFGLTCAWSNIAKRANNISEN